MRLVIQRVRYASVVANGKKTGEIEHGLLIFVGIEHDDSEEDCKWLAGKVEGLRIFADANGVMNLNLKQVEGKVLVISQFTLHASTKKGNRPSYIRAAQPEKAIPLYEKFVKQLQLSGIQVETGVFGAMMEVQLLNDGPVTILIDSRNKE